MEADLRAAAATADSGAPAVLNAPDWAPPPGLGPIPEEFIERARRIREAQQGVLDQLEEAKASAAKHLAALEAVPGSRQHGHSVYLDVTG